MHQPMVSSCCRFSHTVHICSNYHRKVITIYDISRIVRSAFPKAMTLTSIYSEFRVFGMHPYNDNILYDNEFLPAKITNGHLPQARPQTQTHVCMYVCIT